MKKNIRENKKKSGIVENMMIYLDKCPFFGGTID